jgi:putative ATPase
LGPVERPTILQGSLSDVRELLDVRGENDLRFDAIVGRNALALAKDLTAVNMEVLAERQEQYGDVPSHLAAAADALASLIRGGGAVSMAETVGRRSQRLYQLVDQQRLGPALAEKLRAAEEAIYEARDDASVNWDESSLRAALEQAGFDDVSVEAVESEAETRIQPALLDRWFSAGATNERPSYRQRLSEALTPDDLGAIETLYRGQLTGQTVAWHSVTAFVVARRPQHAPQDEGR